MGAKASLAASRIKPKSLRISEGKSSHWLVVFRGNQLSIGLIHETIEERMAEEFIGLFAARHVSEPG